MGASSEYREIASQLAGAQPGQRRRLALQLADEKGVSAQTIYTWGKLGGFTSGRSKRVDSGTRKIEVSDEQLSKIAELIHVSHSEKGRIPMPAHKAIHLAETAGIVLPGTVSEAYLNQWMCKRKISKRHALVRTPHTRLMSKYPNHVHMADASQCAQWFLDDSGNVAHQRRGMEVYKNKDGDPRKITRLLLVDHHSGAFFPWYVQTETTKDWIEFLYLAWSDKGFLADRLKAHLPPSVNLSQLYPFRGVPDLLYADNGSPLKSHASKSLLQSLNIEFMTHLPGNPRAKGSNEGMQRHWERWFESGLLLNKATSLDQLNAWAIDYAIRVNATMVHARHGMTRFDCWSNHIEHIKDVPDFDFYKKFALRQTHLRKVSNDGVITYKPLPGSLPKGQSYAYRVPDVNLWGGAVEVSYCLFDYPRVRIVSPITGQCWETEPLLRNSAGFFPEISATIGENFKSPKNTDIHNAFVDHGFELQGGKWKPAEPITLEKVHLSSDHKTPDPINHNIVAFVPAAPEFETLQTPLQCKRYCLERLNAKFDSLHPFQRQLIDNIPDKGLTRTELAALYQELVHIDPAQIISITEGAQA